MSSEKSHFIIVGQGLAGSLLAWELIRRQQRVFVIDDGHRSSSSRVAAGLVNPLAGMRFNVHPRTADWLKTMHRTYRDIAHALETTPYFHPIRMQRLFRSPEQRRFYRRQCENVAARPYLGKSFGPDEEEAPIRAPHGGFYQHETGYVALPRLLDDLRQWLWNRGLLIEAESLSDKVRVNENGVQVAESRAAQLIFCEGYRMRENPWFDWLPLQPVKGEILRLQSAQTLTHDIVNGAHWLIPLVEGGYRFGATHEHQRIDCQPTPQGRRRLEQGLGQLLKAPGGIEIVEHEAGVRPATTDRNALLGTHPEQRRLHVCNGFGARGALSIPWHARVMADYLVEGTPLPSDVDITRCRSTP